MELLLQEIEKVKALLQGQPSGDMFFIKDLDGRYIWVNTAAEKLLNKTLSEIFMEKNIFNDDIEAEKKLISGETKHIIRYYHLHRAIDKQPVYVKAVKSVMRAKDKTPIGIFLSAHDESEYKNRDLFYAQIILRQLSPKEKEYFVFSMNRNNKQTATELQVSKSRASQYKTAIMDKLKLTEEEYDKLQLEIKSLFDDSTAKKMPDL